MSIYTIAKQGGGMSYTLSTDEMCMLMQAMEQALDNNGLFEGNEMEQEATQLIHKLQNLYSGDQALKNIVVDRLKEMAETVGRMSTLWEEHPELNDIAPLGNVAPMSLDEWHLEIHDVIAKLSGENAETGGE